jgi:hypothetical protein
MYCRKLEKKEIELTCFPFFLFLYFLSLRWRFNPILHYLVRMKWRSLASDSMPCINHRNHRLHQIEPDLVYACIDVGVSGGPVGWILQSETGGIDGWRGSRRSVHTYIYNE